MRIAFMSCSRSNSYLYKDFIGEVLNEEPNCFKIE